MDNRHAAEKLFWELVEDYREWTERQLASYPCDATPTNARALAIAQTVIHLLRATEHANRRNWEAAAIACRDMAGATLQFVSPGDFGAAKDLIWDLAMAAHIAAGDRGELYPEVQLEVLRDLQSRFGTRARELAPEYHALSAGVPS
nr:hypothetical protein [uncultured bacterium]